MANQFHQVFIRQALQNRKKIAVHDQATKKDLTYEQVLIASLILSQKLPRSEEDYVGILVPASAGCLISILAVLMSGKTPVMINYSTGAEKNSLYAQEKCRFETIIASENLLEKIGASPVDGMIFLERLLNSFSLLDKIIGFIKSRFAPFFTHNGSEEENAFILFTSGSEKSPKAVQLTHKNILSNIKGVNDALHFTTDDIAMAVLPVFHVLGLTVTFCLPLTNGSTIVAHPSPLEYQAIVNSIKKYTATTIFATPTFYHGYLKKSEPGDFKSLKALIAGGDKLIPEIRDGYWEKHRLVILEGYGTTETSPVVSVNTKENNKPGSIGPLLNNVEVKITGIETDEDLPPNHEGKILVKGDLVMKGYLEDPEKTAEVLKDGWYDTGDIGLLDDDGFLWYKGRHRRFVKVGGEMVSLVAIENELQKLLSNDSRCCVVSLPHRIKGSEIIATTTEKIKPSIISKELEKEFPSIMIPKQFLYLEELPLMGSGKINFREIEKICHEKFL